MLTEKGVFYWCPNIIFFFFFYKMQMPFGCFMLWAILFAIKLFVIVFYSLHSFCIFGYVLFVCTFTCCPGFLFCFFSFFCFCSVKLPEKQFYSMNIKSRLEDSINLFHYLQYVCVFYEQFVRAWVCLCACLFNYRPPMLRKYVPWCCQGLSKTSTTVCVCECVCVCVYGSRPSIREAQQSQVHLNTNFTNVKHNCIFQ